jgi:alpha-ketoglutarate-dependent taurine dioxygenase
LWVRTRKEEIEEALGTHGGVLFRGFDIFDAYLFEEVVGNLVEELLGENGEHPREALSGSVYSPVFFPPEQRLLWHNENSFNASGPIRIAFCCVRPALTGGETPVVDSRAVLRRLDEQLRKPFERSGVRYVRTYQPGLGRSWQDIFRTTDRSEVQAHCRRENLEYSWDGDILRTSAVRPAVLEHPVTRELSWFNQAQHWHTWCLDEATRSALESLLGKEGMPRQCLYGDGTPIPDEVMAQILQVYQELELSLPWRPGDVMVLDNILMAHGRNPLSGPRKLLVAMGDLTSFDQSPQEATQV